MEPERFNKEQLTFFRDFVGELTAIFFPELDLAELEHVALAGLAWWCAARA